MDVIAMNNEYNDDGKVYVVENDIGRKTMDDQARVADIALLLVGDQARNDVKATLANV